ncbi:beta-phosphoglucomutase [Bacillus sp. 1P06AnD]|uniref:beta-phosphoglucomutase n=1 Tax=Bacillus sp. 1P06AnD TaxID=3132208 RepID=UPI0039A33236
MVKAIIFDLDGVLVTTDHLHYKAWKKIADELHMPFDEKMNHQLRGVSRMDSLEFLLGTRSGEFTDKEKQALAERKNKLYRRLLEGLSSNNLMHGVSGLLDSLEGKGIRMAVGSSSKNATFILEKLGLLDRFDYIVDGNMIQRSKPDPEVFMKAAEGLNALPADCLVVEDAAVGVEAALRAGMHVAAIGDACNSGGVTYHLKTMEDLLKSI